MNQISQIIKKEWYVFLPLMLLCFFLGNGLVYGWQYFFWPYLQSPIIYEGDGLSYLYNFKRMSEDLWYYTGNRANYPWVSDFHDFPQSDFGNYLFFKIAIYFLGTYAAATNMYISMAFPLVFVAMYLLLRVLKISKLSSVIGAVSYAFLAYLFLRVSHIFFVWYFVVPGYIYIYFQLITRDYLPFTHWKKQWKSNLRMFFGLIFLTGFGGYYSLFALFGLIFCGLLVVAYRKEFWKSAYAVGVTGATILLGTALNIYPTLLYTRANGRNLESLIRIPLESELYSLKFSQLFLPNGYHVLGIFRQLSDFFNFNSSSINENVTVTVGLLPALGVLACLFFLLYRITMPYNKAGELLNDKRVLISGLFILFFILLTSVGGWVSLYALLVNSTARGWNRVSIFIACFGLITLCILLDAFYYYSKLLRNNKWLTAAGAALLITIVFLDQAPINDVYKINSPALADRFFKNEKYYQTIEASLPAKAAVFQLPYQIYPGSHVNGMGGYSHLEAHVHTKSLKWSFGGIMWREGEWFYRHLTDLPIPQQLDIARAMGFSGVYIDKRAFCDAGDFIEQATIDYVQNATMLDREQLEKTIIRNKPENRMFIPLPAPTDSVAQRQLANQYLKQIGYVIKTGVQPEPDGQWNEVLDFRRDKTPYFLKFVTGLSGRTFFDVKDPDNQLDPYRQDWRPNAKEELPCAVLERQKKESATDVPVGRWSDARIGKTVQLTFDRPLPQKFRLSITATAVGPNVGKPSIIKVGNVSRTLVFTKEMKKQQVDFEVPANSLVMDIIPYQPFDVSLESRDISANDRRLLGLHLQSMRVEKLD